MPSTKQLTNEATGHVAYMSINGLADSLTFWSRLVQMACPSFGCTTQYGTAVCQSPPHTTTRQNASKFTNAHQPTHTHTLSLSHTLTHRHTIPHVGLSCHTVPSDCLITVCVRNSHVTSRIACVVGPYPINDPTGTAAGPLSTFCPESCLSGYDS